MICFCGRDRDDDTHERPATRGDMHDIRDALNRMGALLMTISDDQAHLDADVQAENDILTAVEAEIAALKAQPAASAVDFTAADAFVARLKGDAPAPAPAPAAPVDAPPAA